MNDQRIYYHSIKEFHIEETYITTYYPAQSLENHPRDTILQIGEYRDIIRDTRSYYSYIGRDQTTKRVIQVEYSSLLSQ
jgi:hypothetical protein